MSKTLSTRTICKPTRIVKCDKPVIFSAVYIFPPVTSWLKPFILMLAVNLLVLWSRMIPLKSVVYLKHLSPY